MTNHSSPDLTNRTINGFSILHRLGVGGMSEVYLAFQESLHRHIALKVMRSDYVGSEDHEKRFLQEARAVASLIHPNIVQVYDVGKFESIHYIAQEYVPGSNLHAYIQRRGALPLAESISILWQATAALQKSASIGIVHRDIKPDNLLLTPDGEVKITDFGLARALGQSQKLTVVGVTLGTPLYMSPEQVQGLPVDSRTDLYSLGATAYHMLSGRPPFSGDTPLALAMQHVQATPVSLKELRPDLPDSLVAIINKLLQKRPDDRYLNASQLAKALREVIDTELDANIDKMVPFAGLVIEHQRLSNLEVTQQLQVLANGLKQLEDPGKSEKSKVVRNWPRRLLKVAACLLLGLSTMGIVYGLTYRDVFRTELNTGGVVRQDSVERQYAIALLENDLQHWNAVSAYFPSSESAKNENYHFKSLLQIARNYIEANSLEGAKETLEKIVKSDSPKLDSVIMAIAKIELAWIERKTGSDPAHARFLYADAERTMQPMEDQIEKKKLILDSLPKIVRIAWDERENTKRTGTSHAS